MKISRITAAILSGIMILAAPVTVLADREDAILDKPYISLGADLNETERATVLQLLGVTEADLANYTVAEVTNAMEHEYLDSYLSSSLIGSRALSSVLVEGKEDGYGIKVTTQNISYCTVGMYQNALATAGIQNADIKVAGPFQISGTAGLVGAVKSYENMTGQKMNGKNVEIATNELVVTSNIAEEIGDSEKAEDLVGFIKKEVVSQNLSDDEISNLIDKAASEMQISLSEEDKQKILDLMDKIDSLDLDVGQLQEQAAELYDRLQDLDLNINLDSEQTKNFLSGLLDSIIEFIQNLIG